MLLSSKRFATREDLGSTATVSVWNFWYSVVENHVLRTRSPFLLIVFRERAVKGED